MPRTKVYGTAKRKSATLNVSIFPGPGGCNAGGGEGAASSVDCSDPDAAGVGGSSTASAVVLANTRKQWGLPRRDMARAVGVAAAAEVLVRAPRVAEVDSAKATFPVAPADCFALLSESRASFDVLMGLGDAGQVLVMPSTTAATVDGGGTVGVSNYILFYLYIFNIIYLSNAQTPLPMPLME